MRLDCLSFNHHLISRNELHTLLQNLERKFASTTQEKQSSVTFTFESTNDQNNSFILSAIDTADLVEKNSESFVKSQMQYVKLKELANQHSTNRRKAVNLKNALCEQEQDKRQIQAVLCLMSIKKSASSPALTRDSHASEVTPNTEALHNTSSEPLNPPNSTTPNKKRSLQPDTLDKQTTPPKKIKLSDNATNTTNAISTPSNKEAVKSVKPTIKILKIPKESLTSLKDQNATDVHLRKKTALTRPQAQPSTNAQNISLTSVTKESQFELAPSTSFSSLPSDQRFVTVRPISGKLPMQQLLLPQFNWLKQPLPPTIARSSASQQINLLLLTSTPTAQATSSISLQQASTVSSHHSAPPLSVSSSSDTTSQLTTTVCTPYYANQSLSTKILIQTAGQVNKTTVPHHHSKKLIVVSGIDQENYSLQKLLMLDPQVQKVDLHSPETDKALHIIFSSLNDSVPNYFLETATSIKLIQGSRCLQHLIGSQCTLPNLLSSNLNISANLIPTTFISKSFQEDALFFSALRFSKELSIEELTLLLICASKIYTQATAHDNLSPDLAITKYKSHLHCIGFALHLLWISYKACKDNKESLSRSRTIPRQISRLDTIKRLNQLLEILDIRSASVDSFKAQNSLPTFSVISSALRILLTSVISSELKLFHPRHTSVHLDLSLRAKQIPNSFRSAFAQNLTINFDTFWCSVAEFMSFDKTPVPESIRLTLSSPNSLTLTPSATSSPIICFCMALTSLRSDVIKGGNRVLVPYFSLAQEEGNLTYSQRKISAQLLQVAEETNTPLATENFLTQAVITSLYYLPSLDQSFCDKSFTHWNESIRRASCISYKHLALTNIGFSIRIIYYLLQTIHPTENIARVPQSILKHYKLSFVLPQAAQIISLFLSAVSYTPFNLLINNWLQFYTAHCAKFLAIDDLFSSASQSDTPSRISIQDLQQLQQPNKNAKPFDMPKMQLHPTLTLFSQKISSNTFKKFTIK